MILQSDRTRGIATAVEVTGPDQPHTQTVLRQLKYRYVTPSELPADETQELWQRICDVVAEAAIGTSDGAVDGGWERTFLNERRSTVLGGCRLCLVYDGSNMVGMVGYRIFDLAGRKCMQMLNGYFRPAYQGRGLGMAVSLRLILRNMPRYPFSEYLLIMEVLNPIVIAGWRARLPSESLLYPSISGERSTDVLRVAAGEYSRVIAPELDIDLHTGVIHRLTPPRRPFATECRDQAAAEYFHQHAATADGDAMLLIVDGNRRALLSGVAEFWRAAVRSGLPTIGRHQRRG